MQTASKSRQIISDTRKIKKNKFQKTLFINIQYTNTQRYHNEHFKLDIRQVNSYSFSMFFVFDFHW